ncbi:MULTISPECIES: DUF975 family protein [Lacticaseibacillus]|uniref:DUF975 family protein n=2 Tax=Lacticaseibacillus zeae TaxID=57037 RepID=A0A5R8LQY7_LACZE|nr:MULTISPECIES: DUF975 family protein [Lacticaseibacillus]OFR96080.1 hypothetical protein HMPREF2861_08535 [Lactobacillus sp. HMSC068F07]KLI75503.1 membrane protein [Lacticaseibacillus casei]TLF39659.1 DUF975 family protein [Lacticaseibacillus zeae]WLV83544.1 DUF975 family protein [Lacticaseibacillus sp. NCIMB 15475]WLV86293.1 DUF975 family protein [Lacticaseibacillus sp. NCIMB 15474]
MDRTSLKNQAKAELNPNFSYYLRISLPALLLMAFATLVPFPSVHEVHRGAWHTWHMVTQGGPITVTGGRVNEYWQMWQSIVIFLSLLGVLLMIGVMFAMIDGLRGRSDHQFSWLQMFKIFERGEYFLGSLLIGLLQWVWIFLWMFLLIVPGIVKAMAYSQAQWIYRDAIDSGQPIGYTEAVTRSRELMSGHKWDYFVLLLSFLGWWLLELITMGLASIWVIPYRSMTLANFYLKLTEEQA